MRHVWKLAVDYILYAPNHIIFNLNLKKFLTWERGTAPFPNPSPRRTVATNFGRAPFRIPRSATVPNYDWQWLIVAMSRQPHHTNVLLPPASTTCHPPFLVLRLPKWASNLFLRTHLYHLQCLRNCWKTELFNWMSFTTACAFVAVCLKGV